MSQTNHWKLTVEKSLLILQGVHIYMLGSPLFSKVENKYTVLTLSQLPITSVLYKMTRKRMRALRYTYT